MRSTFLLLIGIGLFPLQPAFSGDKLIFGAGTISCAEWQTYRLSGDKPNSYGDQWPDDVRLPDIEPRFVCGASGKRGADVRPAFNWNRTPVGIMSYR